MQKNTAIADLHCDLLSYLARGPACTPMDLAVRCSLPQMHLGGVKLQTLAIFTETSSGSAQRGLRQAEIFKRLPKMYPGSFVLIRDSEDLNTCVDSSSIAVTLAIENASSFAEETDDIEFALKNLVHIHKDLGKVIYVSLTWNMENRFGGGAHTSVGLKDDGKRLLEVLSRYGIAVDLSHASDPLAYEIFDYIDKKNLNLRVMASHSLMRSVYPTARNLPDEIAKEIIRRNGVIGLNFIAKFIGSDMNVFLKHLERLLIFGGSNSVCFGADFFFEDDVPLAHRTEGNFFFDDYGNAGNYQKVLDLIRKNMNLPEDILEQLAHANCIKFLKGSWK